MLIAGGIGAILCGAATIAETADWTELILKVPLVVLLLFTYGWLIPKQAEFQRNERLRLMEMVLEAATSTHDSQSTEISKLIDVLRDMRDHRK